MPPSSPARMIFTYILENTPGCASIAAASERPSFTSLSSSSVNSRIASDSVMPSSRRSARSIGTRDSTSVQSPLVKASTSAAFMRLPPLPLALACVSCRGVRLRPRRMRMASRSDSALTVPVCVLPAASTARYLNLPDCGAAVFAWLDIERPHRYTARVTRTTSSGVVIPALSFASASWRSVRMPPAMACVRMLLASAPLAI